MNNQKLPFWKRKSLKEMSEDEWEALCDGCAICCLEKIQDEDSGEIKLTSVSCEYLDNKDCRCSIYEDRAAIIPDCLELSPENIGELTWLPDTCAYRCLSEGRDLEWWHPLISLDPGTVHRAGISIRGKSVSGKYIHPKDIKNFII